MIAARWLANRVHQDQKTQEAKVKIAVVGAGAMGSIFGARFAAGRPRHRARRRRGAARREDQRRRRDVVRGDEETVTRVPATTDPSAVGAVDLVVFFVKCYHTASAAEARAAAGRLGDRRGVAPERLGERRRARAACSRPSRSWSASPTTAALVLEPGRVAHPGAGRPTIVAVRRRAQPTGRSGSRRR